jgi:hypothetical protein
MVLAGTSALSEAAQVRACPVVVGRTSAGEVFGKFEAVAGGVPVPVRGAKQRTIACVGFATAHVWHGYCVCMAFSSAAGVLECEMATAALSTGHDRVRRAEALVFCAHVLMRTSSSDRSAH